MFLKFSGNFKHKVIALIVYFAISPHSFHIVIKLIGAFVNIRSKLELDCLYINW